MAHRQIIPWSGSGPNVTSFQQDIAESDLKTKWTDALQALSYYVPTNGEIINLVRHGFLTYNGTPNDKKQIYALFANNGVSQSLADLLLQPALTEQIATDRQLTKGEVIAMFEAGLIQRPGPNYNGPSVYDLLQVLGIDHEKADEILDLADLRREMQSFNRLISQVGRQVIQRKVTINQANDTLAAMGVPQKTITDLLTDWKTLINSEVPNLSASQIVSAVYYGVETVDEGWADLQALGYSQYDAWRLLSIRMHGPVTVTGYPPLRYPNPPGYKPPGGLL